MKKIVLFFTIALIVSCSSSKPTHAEKEKQRIEAEMNRFIGMKKEALVQNMGFPSRTEELEGKPVLIYSALKSSGLGIFYRQYYEHKLFFFDSYGRVATWLLQTNEIPVEQLNIRVLQPIRIQ